MAKERPQLSIDELHRVRWLVGGLLALVSVWSVAFLEVNAWALIFVTSVAVTTTLIRPSLPAHFSRWANRLAFPFVLGVFAFDYYSFGELLPALVRLGILLVCFRACTYRKRRDDLQLVLVGLFLVVTTGVLTVSIAFAGQIILTAGLSLALLFTRTLVDAAEFARPAKSPEESIPSWALGSWSSLFKRLWRVSDWRLGGVAVFLFAGLVAFSGALFLAIPRYQLENSLFLDRWMSKHSVTGFSDTLHFGEVSDIEKDDGVAMRVEISDPALLPADLYWRMIVLDEYHDRTFQLSSDEREHAFGHESTKSRLGSLGLPVRATVASWTIYLEPGVSRYLPITGGFVQLTFTEPQSFRKSDGLRLVALTRDPSTMKAYRVDKMDTTGTLSNSVDFSNHRRNELSIPAATQALPFDEAQKSQWRKIVAEIDPQRNFGATEFTAAAITWLHQHHTYSLHSEIPNGADDPLLRWVLSSQPGHCELFAGAFTMLARSAGFPCRVVAGFLGGDWNGDYLIVRNSRAHAWCELLDQNNNWIRVDPTANATSQNGQAVDPGSDLRDQLRLSQGWGARWDRVRMLWYRHIVNFDQADQVDLVRALQSNTESSTKRIRSIVDDLVATIRNWTSGPWNWQRTEQPVEGTLAVALFCFLIYRLTRAVRSSDWVLKKRKADPIRAEAGRWLEKIERLHRERNPLPVVGVEKEFHGSTQEEKSSGDSKIAADRTAYSETRDALLRIRYARRETWPDVKKTFRDARRVGKGLG